MEIRPRPEFRDSAPNTKLGGIRQLGARYVVPSQSIGADVPTYLVDVIINLGAAPGSSESMEIS